MGLITSHADPITWHDQADCVFMAHRGFDVGFYKPTGCFAFRLGDLRHVMQEPAIYSLVRPWYNRGSWELFNARWATTTNDYNGFPGSTTFGWEQEFDLQDPPAGPEVLIKSYVQLLDRKRYRFNISVTPYVALDNIGLEFAHFLKTEYVSALHAIVVEKTDGTQLEFALTQARDIKEEVPDAVQRIGFIYGAEERLMFIYDGSEYNWDYELLMTQQLNIAGTDYWVLRIGGAHLDPPRPVAAHEEVVF